MFLIVGTCLAVIIIFGVIGNVLSILVWTIGKRCSNCPTAVYLRFLAVFDTLVLAIPGVELAVYLIEPTIVLRHLNSVFCTILPITPYFWKQASTWTLICLTIEQTMAVCRPLKSIASHSKWRQYDLVLFVTVISFFDNLIVSLSYDWELKKTYTPGSLGAGGDNSSGTAIVNPLKENTTIRQTDSGDATDNTIYNETDYHCAEKIEYNAHTYIVRMGFLAALPLLFLSACNIIITVKLFQRDKKLTNTGWDSHEHTKTTLLASMTARTVAISFVQCVTSIPIVTLDIYVLFLPKTDTIGLVYTVCNSVLYLNHAINIVFYCLLGRSFRRDCVDIFIRRSTNGAALGPTTVETLTS